MRKFTPKGPKERNRRRFKRRKCDLNKEIHAKKSLKEKQKEAQEEKV